MHTHTRESVGPRPTECPTISNPDTSTNLRRLTCRRYNACLEIAVKLDWSGFTCADCGVDDIMTREEQRLEIDGLASLLSSMAIGSKHSDDDDD